MRKFALLFAAAMMVSAPLVVTMTADSYAATKKVKKAKRVARAPAAPADTGPQAPFQQMYNALDDLGKQFAAGGKK
jgi:hypothetical protein